MNTPITDVCLIQRPACFTVTTEGLTQRLVTPPPPPLTSFPSKIGDPYSPSHRLRHLQSLFIVQSMQHLRSVPPYPLSPFLSILEGQVPVGVLRF